MSQTWTSILHEALAGADRLEIHSTVDIPMDVLFGDGDWDPAYAGIGPDGTFEKTPVFCITGVEKIARLVTLIRIDDARSGYHCLCTGFPWLRFFRSGEEIASFTWHHGVTLRWNHGPWPGDGALTAETIAAIPAWFLAAGFTLLHEVQEVELAQEQSAKEQNGRSLASLQPPEPKE